MFTLSFFLMLHAINLKNHNFSKLLKSELFKKEHAGLYRSRLVTQFGVQQPKNDDFYVSLRFFWW